jgi:hypothetical protein
VAGQWPRRPISGFDRAARIDARLPHSARVYDYWLGGKDNFAADRDAAEEAISANPGIVADVRANRAFLTRSVRYLASECGISQFLDIGTGLPAASNTHEVAQAADPTARIVYVDNDPVVLTHARALLTSGPAGRCAYVYADLRDQATILQAAASTLDLSRPVAVLLLMILHLIPDADDPHLLVSSLLAAMPPGSYLILAHPASDVRTDAVTEMARRMNQRLGGTKATLREHAAITQFFAGLDLVAPGVVQPQQWRPEPAELGPAEVPAWCGVAQKP